MARISQRQFTKKSAESGALLGVRNPKGAPLPPEICASTFNEQGGFDSETIISRHADGVIASRFQDLVWDFSAMSGVAKSPVKLRFMGCESLDNEIKTLLLLVMITPVTPRPDVEHFKAHLFLLNRLADVCRTEGLALKNIFNNKSGIRLLKLTKEQFPFYANHLITISECLQFMIEHMGFRHDLRPLGSNVKASLRKVAQEYAANVKQTPIIPSSILKSIYRDTVSEYEALLPVLDELLTMIKEQDTHPMVGLSLTAQKNLCPQLCGTSLGQLKACYPTNYDLAAKYPLARDFLNDNFFGGQKKTHNNGHDFDVHYRRNDTLKAVSYIQRVCQDMIIMFTGMRPVEASLLPYFGSKETLVDGVKYWLIYGFAAKKRKDIQPVEMWVTNEFGYRAFQTAKRIADLNYARFQRQPITIMPDGEFAPELSPLFLNCNSEIVNRRGKHKKTPALSNSYTITEDDLNELKMIDPHRKWEGEPKFAISKPFPVELRQFRRSIAFFASASGVRLVDMKNQLHHLFDSQTFYYGNGSGRANPFLKDKDSFASYFNQVKHEAEAFSFINEVINFDGKLFGASAAYAERNQVFYSTIRDEDRTETVKRFKRGELTYTETHLGGCKTLSPCKSKALGSVTACLSCKDADIRPAKLAHAIKDQAEFVDGLNPDRLEWRTEIQELIVMLDFAIKNIDKAMKDLDRRKDEYKQFSQWAKEFKQMRRRYLKKVENSGRAA